MSSTTERSGSPPSTWLMWGSTEDPYDLDGLPRVERSVDLLLTPARVLSILRDFTLFEQVARRRGHGS
ncbi:MAG: hypothetical protein V9G09_11215 [Candidatus Nanopelagicales bacterium]